MAVVVSPVGFNDLLSSFVEGCKRISDEAMEKHFPTLNKPFFSIEPGSRYVRVVRTSHGSNSVHAFVDRTNGDVLKADSWRKPAKHARGNLFDKDNGLGRMTEYGPAYLR